MSNALDLIEISSTWSFWDKPIPETVPRRVDLPTTLSDSLCLVVQGVRRCGKSTLLQQLIDHYKLNPKHCTFLNFEDPRLARNLTYETLDGLVKQFRALHKRPKRLYFFLDEIQWVEGWQRWLRSQVDRPSGNVFVVTGSNAKLLSGELASALTGRHFTVELFPFDLKEARVHQSKLSLIDYLSQGGFPAPLGLADGDRLRRQYFHDIVERDIRERLRARSSMAIRSVLQMTFESAGSEMSLRRIAAAVGVAVETARDYLEAAQAAYLLFSCPYFSFSERKRASRNRKYYPVDSGLRRVVVTRTGADQGKALELATYLALRKHYGEVFYWRGRGEVDFVVRDGNQIIPYQVSWDGGQDRHKKALTEFYENYPTAAEAFFVTPKSFETELVR